MGALKNETRTLETSNKTPRNKNLPKQLSANEKVEEQLKAVQSAVENVSERLNSARDPVVQIDLHEQLQPLQEKMEAMSSAMKTMRDKRAQTPPTPGRNLERELAEAHKSSQIPNPHTQKRLRNHQPTTESHVDSAKVERVRKARNQKVILKCSTKEDMEAIQNKMRSRKEIKVETAKAANPLLIMKGVLGTQSCCGEKTATCSYCADKTHEWEKCPRRKQNEEPKCKNCWENGIKTEANHEAFSNKCKVRQKWDEIARSRIAYC
ncbi:hypothetical protein EVAR_52382_1 [Eumeta japonica]|uniref:Uncharacterized protein n=1 Tax=Eumeta variegata TaxID=151549 RepID=A0A4C1YVF2_EUMVA|nr:hypothetical protein EVAR_52382_1 [Eumeta japonica]